MLWVVDHHEHNGSSLAGVWYFSAMYRSCMPYLFLLVSMALALMILIFGMINPVNNVLLMKRGMLAVHRF